METVETFVLEGHIVDSLILPKVLDLVLERGADYRLLEVDIGRTPTDPSRAVIEVTAPDDEALLALAELLQVHGANPQQVGEATTEPAPADGATPSAGAGSVVASPTCCGLAPWTWRSSARASSASSSGAVTSMTARLGSVGVRPMSTSRRR